MREVNIGTKRFTKVVTTDDREFNAHHRYIVVGADAEMGGPGITGSYANVNFQKGPIKENGVNGCHNEDLIAIVLDRLQCLNTGNFKCRGSFFEFREDRIAQIANKLLRFLDVGFGATRGNLIGRKLIVRANRLLEVQFKDLT